MRSGLHSTPQPYHALDTKAPQIAHQTAAPEARAGALDAQGRKARYFPAGNLETLLNARVSGRRVDHEAELGVVIGRTAARVGRDQAVEHVFGYVPLLDITMRGDEDRSYRKSFDTFTPIGPAIVTADEVPDPGMLDIELTVNGELRQRANTRDLIYDVPRLVEFYSAAMTLEPGDVIATGTPAGVGPLSPGDEIVLDIGTVGRLSMRVSL
jgi:2-keto-4-pentenoate hydratase/2-oxohepta-3-ene-1,7-dioic acid hydratase in catechol pathway